MEYRMKDIMEPPKTLEEQKKEAREAAMAAGAEVLGEEWKPGTLENVNRFKRVWTIQRRKAFQKWNGPHV